MSGYDIICPWAFFFVSRKWHKNPLVKEWIFCIYFFFLNSHKGYEKQSNAKNQNTKVSIANNICTAKVIGKNTINPIRLSTLMHLYS
jgi:hypothetical protein